MELLFVGLSGGHLGYFLLKDSGSAPPDRLYLPHFLTACSPGMTDKEGRRAAGFAL
jgi:hypothetical protein